MNNVSINVKSDSGAQIGVLDVQDADMNIVYQLSDVREPDKRNANYVRKFKLPGTKNNNAIFTSMFENGYTISDTDPSYSQIQMSYNPNLKLNAQVTLNNNIFFEGSLQLNKVLKKDNKLIGYEVTIYGTLGDFFGDIGDASMTQLDISEYNHYLTRDNIVYSWNTNTDQSSFAKTIVEKYASGYSSNKYFGDRIWKYGSLQYNTIGDGYVYPLFYTGGADLNTIVSSEKWQPATYVYTLMKKVFDKWGWKWKSEFFESEYFKRLIIPCSKDSLQITEEQKEKTEFLANVGIKTPTGTGVNKAQRLTQQNSSVANTVTSGNIIFDYDTTSPAQPQVRDVGGTYDTTTGVWKSPKNGQFTIQARLKATIEFQAAPPGGYAIVGPDVTFKAKIINNKTKVVLAEKAGKFLFTTTVKASGYYYQQVPITVDYTGFISAGTEISVIFENTIPTGQYAAKTITLTTGQAFGCNIMTYCVGAIDDSSNFSATLNDKQLQDNDYVNMNMTLPDMSVSDFITGINKMFNLYWQKTGNDKEFYIEPKDNFYKVTDDDILDFTGYADNKDNITIEPMYDLTANKIDLTYKSDNDYLNDDYQNNNEGVYGHKMVYIENDFHTEVMKVETTFSPSPLYSPPFNPGIILTAFIQKDGTKFKRVSVKPRILIWGGMLPYTGTPIEIQDAFGTSGKKTYIMKAYGAAPAIDSQLFPYAGHLDNPYTPNEDLDYGVPEQTYFTIQSYTNNNLYNKYWRSHINEIIDPNQHLLTFTGPIPSEVMRNLDLRWVIQFENVYYRINKITYNPITELAEVELFKLKEYIAFSPKMAPSGFLTVNPGGTTPGTGPVPNTTDTTIWDDHWDRGWSVRPWQGGVVDEWLGDGRPWTIGSSRPQFQLVTGYSSYKPSTGTSVIGSPAPKQPWTTTKVGTNTFSDTGYVAVQGEWNIVSPSSKYVSVNGSYNNVTADVTNATITGNYNTVLPGLTNVNIVGDNIVARRSNTAYINGVEIDAGGVTTTAKTLRIMSPPNLRGGVMMGGKNSVGDFTTGKTKGVVSGNGQTNIQPPNTNIGPPTPTWQYLINMA